MNSKQQNPLKKLLAIRGMGAALTAFVGLVIIYIAFGLINPAVFSGQNILNLLRSMSKYLLIGIAQSYVLITGNIDLAIGSMVGMSAMITATLMTGGMNPVLAILIALVSCLLIGVVNGYLVGKFKLPPFIATLGTMFVARGIAYMVNGNRNTDAIATGVGKETADKFQNFFYYGKGIRMDKKKDTLYISDRVWRLGLFVLGMITVMFLLSIWEYVREQIPLWPTILTGIFGLSYCLAGWFWIIKPYRNSEKIIERFLEGYLVSEADAAQAALLTPYTAEQVKFMEKFLYSPKLMDLNKRQAQYLALQNQINPHFLYNTLESIRGEALIAGLDGVADMTEALAKFFRYTITKVENLVSVEEELDNCETYFGIQKYRFGDRLKLHIEYDPDEYEKIMNCRIPKLTLQPILENSIIHGTELKLGAGNLYIRFACTEDRLIICVSDDGVGMDEEKLAALNRKLGRANDSLNSSEEEKGGIALVNVNNSIHLIFGDEYGMHVYSVPQRGTDVEITIPLTENDREVKNRSVLK